MVRKAKATTAKIFTLTEAMNYFDTLANAKASIRNWVDSLITLVHYHEQGESAFPTTMTKKELGETYEGVNVLPIITDFDKVETIIDEKVMSSRSKQPIAIDSRKQMYLSVIRLTQKKSPCQIDKKIRERYNDKLKEVEQASNQLRNLNTAKRGNLKYPEFDWTTALFEYHEFLTTKSFTNTAKGRKDLRMACIVGLYVEHRPRRVQDYSSLQYYSKKPIDRELDGRNVLYVDDGKMYLSIDVFKTRWRTRGNSTQKTELLPRYVKEVNTRLASTLKDYIKRANVKDMSKLTPAEKKAKKNFYVFYKETGTVEDAYDENSFSKLVSQAMKHVFNGRTGLSVNSLRHMFNTWISDNLNQFNDAQLQEIAIDVGDTPKQLPTNLRYRIQDARMEGQTKTAIEGDVIYHTYMKEMQERNADEQGSVGDVPQEVQQEVDADEVESPVVPTPMVVDGDIDNLYMKLGRAMMEVKNIELMIIKKLGM